MARYWVHRDGRQLGPFDEARILEDYAKGVLRPTDQLWTEGMERRVPVVDAFAMLHSGNAGARESATAPMPPPIPAPIRTAPSARAPHRATELAYAGFWVRWCAAGIDMFIALSVMGVIALGPDMVWISVVQTEPQMPFMVLGIPISVGVMWIYFAGLESGRRRATWGKLAMGLEVRHADTLGRIGFGRASVRWLAHWLSFALLLIGFLVQPFTARKQALHDLVSGTVVVTVAPREPVLVVVLSVGLAVLPGLLFGGILAGALMKAIEMYGR